MNEQIFCSTIFPPPRRYDGTNKVRSLCEISWNKKIATNTLPRFTNRNRENFAKLNYRIQMDCEDGTVNFVVCFKGQKVGGHEVEVQFT